MTLLLDFLSELVFNVPWLDLKLSDGFPLLTYLVLDLLWWLLSVDE